MRQLLVLLAALLLATAAQAQSSRTIEIAVENRAVTGPAVETSGGLGVVRVTQGDQVELRWTTDESTEVHLHGYDIKADLTPGNAEVMTFEARATGRFAIESHGFGNEHSHAPLLYLEVLPR